MISEKSLPVWEDFSLVHSDYEGDWDKLTQEKALLGVEEYDVCSKLLGWPDIIQNNMTRECELISRGFYLGNGWKEISEKEV